MIFREIFQAGLTTSILCLFLFVFTILAGQVPLWCIRTTSSDGLNAAECDTDTTIPRAGQRNFDYQRVPTNLYPHTQVINLRPKNKATGCWSTIVIEPGSFTRYPKLERILILRNFYFRMEGHEPIGTSRQSLQNALEQTFTELSLLNHLEMKDCALTDDLVVHLPLHLKYINFDDNLYQNLDLHWSVDVEEISAKNNQLANVPRISVTDPPLKILRLSGNPLQEMKVTDIARFCELTLLELDFPPDSHYVSEDGYCQCVLLKKWAAKVNIEGPEKVKCYSGSATCSEDIFEEAAHHRKLCPILKRSETKEQLKIMKYIFLAILLAVLLACAILYTIRHFHLRQYMREHFLRMNQPVDAGAYMGEVVEGEEEEKIEGSEDSNIEG